VDLKVEVGQVWGQRDKPRTPGLPLSPVEVLQLGPEKSNRVRVRRITGEFAGLDEWVPLTTLVVPWEHAEGFLSDELSLIEVVSHGASADEVEWDAAQHVLDHLGHHDGIALGYGRHQGVVWLQADVIAPRYLGVDASELLDRPLTFVNQDGELVGPWELGLEVVVAVAQAHPDQLLASLRTELRIEREAAVTGWRVRPGGRGYAIDPEFAAESLRRTEQLHRTIHGWVGVTGQLDAWNESAALRGEIERLHRLVERTASWLRGAGHPVKAELLLKELRELEAGDESPRVGAPRRRRT